MAMAWRPFDGAVIDPILALARASWDRADLDATWAAAGWPMPWGRSVATGVFENGDYAFGVGSYVVTLAMRFEPVEEITGFGVAYATLCDEADVDDPDVREFVSAAVGEGWSGDIGALRPEFDDNWRTALGRLTGRLGQPDVTGTHSPEWRHAVWRLGDRLIALVQGENFDSYGWLDDASLWVLHHPAAAEIPRGERFYAFLCGDTDPNELAGSAHPP
ncbi:MAG TPA: hypothetical protein VFV67_06255 [Actinophytocola sp.]|uniref:hypothetical protein n=1 Tax=Actinophytocola sp. TaxID=1872138 RepID=UPI002DBAF1D1|nr:hypothetical protein [Actinophytocola sp.]HEU5470236.1 hypothetical protein [Actinophytocola sp.]